MKKLIGGTLILFLFGVIIYNVLAYLRAGALSPDMSKLLAVIGTISILALPAVFLSIRSSRRERAFAADWAAGKLPEDQKPIAAFGTIRALEKALVTPISKLEAIHYTYSVFHFRKPRPGAVRDDDAPSKEKEIILGGAAGVPFIVKTTNGDFKVAGVPAPIEVQKRKLKFADIEAQVRAHAATLPQPDPQEVSLSALLNKVKDIKIDEPSAREWKTSSCDQVLSSGTQKLQYEEQVLPNNIPACVIAIYSAHDRTLQRDPKTLRLRVIPGDKDEVDRFFRLRLLKQYAAIIPLSFGTLGYEFVTMVRNFSGV